MEFLQACRNAQMFITTQPFFFLPSPVCHDYWLLYSVRSVCVWDFANMSTSVLSVNHQAKAMIKIYYMQYCFKYKMTTHCVMYLGALSQFIMGAFSDHRTLRCFNSINLKWFTISLNATKCVDLCQINN